MLCTQYYFSRAAASIALCFFVAFQLPAGAEVSPEIPPAAPVADGQPITADHIDTGAQLIAQAGGSAVTGSGIGNIVAASSFAGPKLKGELLITDSLWGNLILDLAYQRDPELRKLYKRFGLVNLGTMAAVAGIAGGTVAQGVIALATLNPQQGNDTYLPGAIGIGMSGLTIATLITRGVINHHLAACMRNRQLAIKHKVEAILARLEQDNNQHDSNSKIELIELIGERATNEWLQLWRSCNAVATLKEPPIALRPSPLIIGQNQQ